MKKMFIPLVVAAVIVAGSCNERIAVTYPVTKKVDSVDNYFGTKIADPYRWLENDTSKETTEWVKAQNAITFDYLSRIPFREKIREHLKKTWNYPRYSVPFKHGPFYFYSKNDGLQNQAVLYYMKGLEGEPKILLDPNTLSADGTVSLAGYRISRDGKYLAYRISRSGSDWNEIYVKMIESGKTLSDKLQWVKFANIAWMKDGFYYSRYKEPATGAELVSKIQNQKVYYHKVGTAQKDDILVYENEKFPFRNYRVAVTEDERFVLLFEYESTSGAAVYFKDLIKKEVPFKLLESGFENEYSLVDNLGDNILMVTNFQAPKKKLVLINPQKPEPKNWITIIPEREDVIQAIDFAGERIIAQYIQNAMSKAFVYDLNGKFLQEIELPGIGTLSGFSGRKDENIAFYAYTAFRFPTTIFKYDGSTNKSTTFKKSEISFEPEDYEAKQVSYLSKDKTTITMFLVYKKGIKLDGNNPTLLYGYGGFNLSMTPNFNIARTIFLENGGVYAVPNLRGGGEYGEEWHKAGTKDHKQNVFDDFIAAAQFLIDEKYTCKEKLAIMGGSNGGLLVGAAMTQRPDLFSVAIPQVGVMDMLRYHKFTIGWTWKSDYGSSETKEGFDYLIKYSPLHNLKKGIQYPATLAFATNHDDRVVPMHTFKFIATLQEFHAGTNPALVRIQTQTGHGAGTPTNIQIEEATDLWSFIFYNLGMKFK